MIPLWPASPDRDSLHHELRRTYLGIALFTVLIVAISMLIGAILLLRGYAAQNLQLIARSASYTVEAALVFHDDAAAQDAIADFESDANVARIEVVYPDGTMAAWWQRPNHHALAWAAHWCAWWLLPNQVIAPVQHHGDAVGSVRVAGDGRPLIEYLLFWLSGIGVSVGLSTVGALYLARRMLRDIEVPLRNLAQVAHAARTQRELARRVPSTRITELRELGDDFNGLMAELESWQHHLRHENAMLSYQAHHDNLTGVSNRARFERVLDGLLSTARGATDAFGLLFIDCDDFKSINDSYGHDVGDQALVHVSSLLRQHVRDVDLVARIGGDEFAVLLLPPYVPGAAAILAARLGAAAKLPAMTEYGVVFAVSFSIGIAEYPRDGADAQGLRVIADADMYRNKRSRSGFRE